MKNTMIEAIKAYAEMTNQTANEVLEEMNAGNKAVIDSIMMLMFAVAK